VPYTKGQSPKRIPRFPERTVTLIAALERLSKEHDRASTALQAETLLLQVRLASTRPEHAEPLLNELRGVVRRSEGLVGYPLEPLAEIIGELGGVFGDLQGFPQEAPRIRCRIRCQQFTAASRESRNSTGNRGHFEAGKGLLARVWGSEFGAGAVISRAWGHFGPRTLGGEGR
jgi:hypothetical protein